MPCGHLLILQQEALRSRLTITGTFIVRAVLFHEHVLQIMAVIASNRNDICFEKSLLLEKRLKTVQLPLQ